MLQARHEALRKPTRLRLSLSYGRLVGQLKIVHNVLSFSQPWKRGEIVDICWRSPTRLRFVLHRRPHKVLKYTVRPVSSFFWVLIYPNRASLLTPSSRKRGCWSASEAVGAKTRLLECKRGWYASKADCMRIRSFYWTSFGFQTSNSTKDEETSSSGLFDSSSPTFRKALRYASVSLGVALFFSLIDQVVRCIRTREKVRQKSKAPSQKNYVLRSST